MRGVGALIGFVPSFARSRRTLAVIAVVLMLVVAGASVVTAQTTQPPQSQSPIVAGSELETLRQKADQADAAALCQLGNIYKRGEGVAEDYVEALKWFNLGFMMSATIEGNCIDERERLRQQTSQTQIAEAKKKAAEWQSRVGFTLPTIRETASPHYDESALKEGVKGEVLLAIVIDSKGIPQQCRVMRSLDRRLDLEAVKAARKFLFTPARLGDRAVPVVVDMTISFNFRK
jgi:TonB family protein